MKMWLWVTVAIVSAPGAIRAMLELYRFLGEAFRG